MFCQNCGKKIEGGDLFCPFCGAKQQQVNPSENAGASFTAGSQKLTRKGLGIAVICVLIVIVLALVLIGSLCTGGPKQVVKEYYQAIEKCDAKKLLDTVPKDYLKEVMDEKDLTKRELLKEVQAYLDKRRIRRGIAVRFGMGAAPDSWDALLTAMTHKGYTKQELISAGLAVNGKNGRLYDKFRNRLMLPVIDVRGDVVGFGSRVLDKSEPKYMNTPETLTYSKRRILYGMNLAKKSKRSNIILCEGNLDVVTLHQAGFDNAVASMGTALTQEQLRLLSRYTKELVLCYDNDNAGQQATRRALELLNNSEFSVKVLQLPRRLVDGEYIKQDADDFIKLQGPAAFERLLTGSENGVEFRLDQIAGKYDLTDDTQRIAYAQEVSEELAKLENAVERAAILCLGEYISERELPMAVSSAPKNNDAPTLAELQGAAGEEPISMTLDEMERAAILRTLQDTGDNKSEAARRLGITRATLHNKLRRYDME